MKGGNEFLYDNITFEKILKKMLDRIPNTVDKREGSIIYDALAPAAAELQLLYIELETIYKQTFADTADREFLIKRAAERNIKPYMATRAVSKGEFNIDIPLGSRFSLDDLNFTAIEKISDGVYKMECETAGRAANGYVGRLIPIDYIKNLTKSEITEILIPGEDEEQTEQLRQRYLNSLNSQAFGGNISDYKEKVNAIAGVGGVKVYPAWNGGGTVKLIVISSELESPTNELLQNIQTIIDPETNHGEGLGLAPIGHNVTVEGVKKQTININADISLKDGWEWEDVKPFAEKAIDEYFLELNARWEASQNIIVRTSYIETRFLNIDGILDIRHTKLNGIDENFIVNSDSIAIRGGLNV